MVFATQNKAGRVWLERALAQGLQEARSDSASLPPAPTEVTKADPFRPGAPEPQMHKPGPLEPEPARPEALAEPEAPQLEPVKPQPAKLELSEPEPAKPETPKLELPQMAPPDPKRAAAQQAAAR